MAVYIGAIRLILGSGGHGQMGQQGYAILLCSCRRSATHLEPVCGTRMPHATPCAHHMTCTATGPVLEG